jgi:hypothetical protein
MGDWEDLCDHHGKPNDGDSDWLIDKINSDNEIHGDDDDEKSNRDDIGWEQKTATGDDHLPKTIFQSLQEVKEYSMKNQGQAFSRNPDGPGWIMTGVNNTPRSTKEHEEGLKRQENITDNNKRTQEWYIEKLYELSEKPGKKDHRMMIVSVGKDWNSSEYLNHSMDHREQDEHLVNELANGLYELRPDIVIQVTNI